MDNLPRQPIEVQIMSIDQPPSEVFNDEPRRPEPEYEIRAKEIRRKMEYLRSLRSAAQAKQEANRRQD